MRQHVDTFLFSGPKNQLSIQNFAFLLHNFAQNLVLETIKRAPCHMCLHYPHTTRQYDTSHRFNQGKFGLFSLFIHTSPKPLHTAKHCQASALAKTPRLVTVPLVPQWVSESCSAARSSQILSTTSFPLSAFCVNLSTDFFLFS